MRQAFAGMLWSKQFYHYDVARWLDGDPAGPPPPAERRSGRNAGWRHLSNRDVISMPDKWEYPWYAAWDLAFHCVTLAHVDPEFAKEQLRLMTREWYMHPNGQLPAYEWDFGDVNPPVHALAALRVFQIDGARDVRVAAAHLPQAAAELHLVGQHEGPGGRQPLRRRLPRPGQHRPVRPLDAAARRARPGAGRRHRVDGLYCLGMLEIALVLAGHDPAYEDVAVKFFEHFTLIQAAMNDEGLWDEADGFYYDQIRRASDGDRWPVRARSMTGLIPLYAAGVADPAVIGRLEDFPARVREFLRTRPAIAAAIRVETDGARPSLLALVGVDRLPRLLQRLGDEEEFLSPYGVRALSAVYRGRPFEIWQDGHVTSSVDYEPAESTTALFGGNSNWRGPIWFPVNYLLIGALLRYHQHLGDDYRSSTPGGRGSSAPCGGLHRPGSAPGRDLPPGRARPAAGVRRARALPDRPGVARRAALPRVLQRRRRRRPRRVAPDRLDRPGRGSDRPPVRDAGGAVMRTASEPSSPALLGAHPDEEGTTFALFSSVAEAVELCLFDDSGAEERVALRPGEGFRWEGHVPGIGPGRRYGVRVHGPWDPAAGARCNPAKLLLDPYARAVAGGVSWHPAVHGGTRGGSRPPGRRRLGAVRAPLRRLLGRVRLGRRRAARHSPRRLDRLRAARQGLHPAAPGGAGTPCAAPTPAWPTRRSPGISCASGSRRSS